MAIRLTAKPTLAILGTVRKPLPNTMAFGGVAAGNINAIEEANVAEIMSKYGWICIARAQVAMIGRKVVETAVFDITSVRNIKTKFKIKRIIIGGNLPNI